MKRIVWIAVSYLFISVSALAQNPSEALRYSLLKPGGTARGLALSGAMGAIGADATAITINPAGYGMYRRSEAMATGQLVFSESATHLDGNTRNDNRIGFNFGNAGVVFTKLFENSQGDPTRGKWRSISLGLNYNRLANFNSQRFYESTSTNHSVLADYRNELNASALDSSYINPDYFSLGTVTAYNAGLLNHDSTSLTHYSAVTDNYTVNQQINVRTSGGIDELSLGFGTNFNNKFYFGGSLGLPFVNYQEDIIITETNTSGIPHFNNFKEERILSSSAMGFNAKFGILYRPNNYFRVGAAVHSPNWYSFTDHYSTESTSSLDTANYGNQQAGVFEYKLRSPFRTTANAAVFFNRYGFFSIDYEYADYGRARYTYAPTFADQQNSLNDLIKSTLQKTHTLRAGVELAYNIFRLRGGVSYTTSPIAKASRIGDADYVGMTYSCGIGFRWKRVYLDLAYLRSNIKTTSSFATDVVATNNLKQDHALLTFGFNFGRK